MTLIKLRAIGAGCCLVATAVMLPVSTVQAGAIPSQLAMAPDLATARTALSEALALERLAGLGFTTTVAERLVATTRAARVELLLKNACRVSDVEGQLQLSLDVDVLHNVVQRVRHSLARDGLDESAIVAGIEQGLHNAAEMNPCAWLEGLGLAPQEAALLTEELSGVELAWLGEHSVEATTYVGKVVGINWTGLILLLLPLVGVAWVAAAGAGEAAGTAVAGLVVGLIFVLFTEPAFIFGSREDVIM